MTSSMLGKRKQAEEEQAGSAAKKLKNAVIEDTRRYFRPSLFDNNLVEEQRKIYHSSEP